MSVRVFLESLTELAEAREFWSLAGERPLHSVHCPVFKQYRTAKHYPVCFSTLIPLTRVLRVWKERL